jgi:hypothetical protein
MSTSIDGVVVKTPIAFHKCTQDDLDSFHPPTKKAERLLTRLTKTKLLNCIDDYKDLYIFGEDETADFRRFEIV